MMTRDCYFSKICKPHYRDINNNEISASIGNNKLFTKYNPYFHNNNENEYIFPSYPYFNPLAFLLKTTNSLEKQEVLVNSNVLAYYLAKKRFYMLLDLYKKNQDNHYPSDNLYRAISLCFNDKDCKNSWNKFDSSGTPDFDTKYQILLNHNFATESDFKFNWIN